METMNWNELITGAYTTPLIGRTRLLEQLDTQLTDPTPGPHAVVISGQGGIGKTRLLIAALEMASRIPGMHVARAIVDLYHVPTHTPGGLAFALYGALRLPPDAFRDYEAARAKLEALRLSGNITAIAEQRAQTLEAFGKDLRRLATQGRVILALDTAERLVYGANQLPMPILQYAEVWAWLLKSLPTWGNVTLLIAGRPQIELLRQGLAQALVRPVAYLPVDVFEETESLAYFEAVTQRLRDEAPEVAERIAALTPQNRRLMHLYSGGRPILLALLVDLLSTGGLGQIPEVLRSPSRTPLTDAGLEEVRNLLEQQLVARLQLLPRVGGTVIALGRLPKGADAELLVGLLGGSIEEAAARLDEVRSQSFVKIRPSDRRVFLHDEMYTLLSRQIYEDEADALAADAAGKAIMAYYRTQQERCQQKLNELYRPAEEQGRTDIDLAPIVEINNRRISLLAEIVYYRLRQNAVRGFQRYYRYIREAAMTGDTALDLQLQAEVLAFLVERDPSGQAAAIDGLERGAIVGVMALRPVVRAWAEGKYTGVLDEANRLRQQGAMVLDSSTPGTRKILDAWEATALIALGGAERLSRARALLDRAIEDMEVLLAGGSATGEWQKWRVQAVTGFAYRVRGYLNRTCGLMQDAANDYERAAQFWADINLQVEEATTLNDMGFALAELGKWSDARALVERALRIRRTLGPRSPAGLSMNTLAMIDIREGNYLSAIERAERALALFRTIEDWFGAGLALTALSEARRRRSMAEESLSIEERSDLLRRAREEAQEALGFFKQIGAESRQVEALIEDGCACRDLIRVLQIGGSSPEELEPLIVEGVQALDDAAKLAGEAIRYRRVDALVNQAWLGSFVERDDLFDKAALAAEAVIPKAYKITRERGLPVLPRDASELLLWPQQGKLHTLYGYRAFRRYSDSLMTMSQPGDTTFLEQAVEQYVLGLEYNALYGADNRDMRRARERIYEQLQDLTSPQLRVVAAKVEQVEAEYQLSKSELRKMLVNRALWRGNIT
jgi:tetratricopeptide (TPR) repeat protein